MPDHSKTRCECGAMLHPFEGDACLICFDKNLNRRGRKGVEIQ